MRQNVLEFKNDIKLLVEEIKTGKNWAWMHPIYRAYYIIKHQIVDKDLQKANIEDDIERSYKALRTNWDKDQFRKIVNEYLELYPETTVRID